MTNADADIDQDINDESEDQDLDNQDEDTDEELDDDSDEDDSDDTSDDSDSDEDEDDSDSSDTTDDGSDEDSEADEKKKRKLTTIDRLKKERDEWKAKATGEKPKSSTKVKKSTEDHALLARLENRGVMHPDDQAYVIKFAKADGISPIDALKDQVVKDRLERNKKVRLQNKSTPAPSNRTGKVTKNLDYYINKGILPSDPVLAEKVQDEMARRAKAGR